MNLINVDLENTKRLSFEQLGRVLSLMDALTVIKYDEECNSNY